jgi:glutamate-ammonia-ligase adenylyltransferase
VDIEFLVQYLQLLHGKQLKRIRVPGTYNALQALKREGLLDEEEYVTLVQAYLFMRQLETRMRIVSNQASSELSRDPARLLPLALRMGYLDEEGVSAGQKLLDDYVLMSRQVRNIFNKLLGHV